MAARDRAALSTLTPRMFCKIHLDQATLSFRTYRFEQARATALAALAKELGDRATLDRAFEKYFGNYTDEKGTGEKGVKRVVGLPGDAVIYIDKQLFVNGSLAIKKIRERLPRTDKSDLLLEQRLFDRTFNVLELYGQSLSEAQSAGRGYFLLGDNRDDSIDSRHYGRLSEGRIKCKALAVLGTEEGGKINFNGFRWL